MIFIGISVIMVYDKSSLLDFKAVTKKIRSWCITMNNFINNIEALYNDFARRIDVANWEALLGEELNMNLIAVDEVSEQMLEFLMTQHIFPIEVWLFFDQLFDWTANQAELNANYPPSFIGFIVTQITADINNDIRFHLFDLNKEINFDRFIWLVREVSCHLDCRSLQGVENLIEELEDFGIDHPDYLMEKARILAIEGNPNEGLELLNYIFDTYAADYETSTYFKFIRAFVLVTFHEQDKLEEALLLFEELLELNPDDTPTKDGLADCYEKIGDLDKAYQFTIDHIIAELPSDNYALQRLHLLSQKLLTIYQEKYEMGEASDEEILELARYYRQSGKEEVAFELLQENPQLDFSYKYHRMLANIYATLRDSENAVNYALQSIKLHPSIFAYDSLIKALIAERCFEEALEAIKGGVNLPVEGYDRVGKALLFDAKARIFYRMGEHDDALAASDEALEVHDRIAHLYNTRAEIFMKMKKFQKAMDSALISQTLQPFSIAPYEIQAEICYLVHRVDDLLDVVKEAEQYQIPLVDKLAYYYALTLRDQARKENADMQSTLNILLELEQSETFIQLDHSTPEEGLFAKLLGQIAYTYWRQEEKDHALQYVLRAINEANEFIEENILISWYEFQVIILGALKKHDEALDVCLSTLEKFPNNISLLKHAAQLHSNNRSHKEVLKLLEQAYEIDQQDDDIYIGLEYSYRMLNRHTKALEISRKWIAAIGSVAAYRAFASHYKRFREFDEELEILQDALVQHPNNEDLLTDLAAHYVNKRAFKEVAEIRSQILEVNPDNVEVRIDLAHALTFLGQHEEALEVVDIGLEKEPNRVAYYARRGMTFQDAKKPYEAIAEYEKALDIVAQDNDDYWTEAELISRIGTIYFAMLNDGETALKYRHKSVELEPQNDHYLKLLGIVYEAYKKDCTSALIYYVDSVEKLDTPYNLLALAELTERMGALKKAKIYYEDGLAMHRIRRSSNHNDYVIKARLLIGIGHFDDAFYCLKVAEDVMKEDGRNSCGACGCVYRAWAKYYLRLNQLEEALEAVHRSLELENSVGGHALKDEILEKMSVS